MLPSLPHARVALAGCVLALFVACAAHPVSTPPPRETRLLRVGTSGDHPPFSSMRDGQVSGFDERGYRLEWVRFRWPELMADFGAQRFDMAASGLTIRPERSLAGRYTVPVARNGACCSCGAPPGLLRPGQALTSRSRSCGRSTGPTSGWR